MNTHASKHSAPIVLLMLALVVCPFLAFVAARAGHGNYYVVFAFCPVGTVAFLTAAYWTHRRMGS